MFTRDYECYGGPIDGQTMPVPIESPGGGEGLHAFMMHMGADHVPHFYMLATRVDTDTLDTYEVLEYAGTDPSKALAHLRETEPELVEKIERDIEAMRDGNFDMEDFDDCETD